MEYDWKRHGIVREGMYRFGNFLSDHSRKIYAIGAIALGLALAVGTALYVSSRAEPVKDTHKQTQRETLPSKLEDIDLNDSPVSPQ